MIDEAERLALLIEIRRLIGTLPHRPDELEFVGEVEQRIACLYLRLEMLEEAGDWWVRAAREAEKYNQIFEAKVYLQSAVKRLPNVLAPRRELQRVTARLEQLQKSSQQ
jgi:hypothetical protein